MVFTRKHKARRSRFVFERKEELTDMELSTYFCKRRKRNEVSFSSRSGTPRGIRTPDLLLRRQLLYPAELLAHVSSPHQRTHRQTAAQRSGLNLGRKRELPLTLERVMGIEPTYPAWKAGVLPLNYTRTSSPFSHEIIPYEVPECQQLSENFSRISVFTSQSSSSGISRHCVRRT